MIGKCSRPEEKTHRQQPRKKNLLGLKYRESRSGQLDKITHHYHREEEMLIQGEVTDNLCAAGEHTDMCDTKKGKSFSKRDHSCGISTPRNKTSSGGFAFQ